MASGPESGKRRRLERPTLTMAVPLLPPKMVPLRCAFKRLLVDYVSKTGKPLAKVSLSEVRVASADNPVDKLSRGELP